jgi:hypothetical protein
VFWSCRNFQFGVQQFGYAPGTDGRRAKPGPKTRFADKLPMLFRLCLPKALHDTLKDTADRLGIKREDVLCELLTQYAQKLVLR